MPDVMLRVVRPFHIFDAGDSRIDFIPGQAVSAASLPHGHSADAWIEKGLARPSFWSAVRTALGRLLAR